MNEEYAYVYIMASGFKKLYIGITTEIEIRVKQHKEKRDPDSFAAKYNINQLVYYEKFVSITEAIKREKQLKGWLRIEKIQLIVNSNPTWRDLSADWGRQMLPYQWPEEKV